MFGRHLILYDGNCPLCNRAIRFILKKDKEKEFVFAPLQGDTANKVFQKKPELSTSCLDSLILIENFRTVRQKEFVEGQGALRILWYLRGLYRILGLLSFLPSALFDQFYRFIAKRRYKLFSSKDLKSLPHDAEKRFLP